MVPVDEFAKKLINQGMILGTSAFVYKATPFIKADCFTAHASEEILHKIPTVIVSKHLFSSEEDFEVLVKNYLVDNGFLSQDISDSIMIVKSNVHADVSLVNSSDELDIEAFKNWRREFKSA